MRELFIVLQDRKSRYYFMYAVVEAAVSRTGKKVGLGWTQGVVKYMTPKGAVIPQVTANPKS